MTYSMIMCKEVPVLNVAGAGRMAARDTAMGVKVHGGDGDVVSEGNFLVVEDEKGNPTLRIFASFFGAVVYLGRLGLRKG